ncbi:MAG: nucleotidyltransferase domain-containing protein, partial [Candidatus Aenigmarchaeota archaeon]|nr:nucleotidyltransferase domain-containing protein [Candidatus Aenigmarchaeota archaeon]MDW8160414.1 nucleotidyltransferase domain-containing protein [Candidatus Aenigmarchaeota archaeon]
MEPYESIIEKLLEALKNKYGDRLVSVVLFGSLARKEARKDSDIDLLIVIKDLPKSRLKRQEEFLEVESHLEDLLEKTEGFVDLSPILRTPEEILKYPPILLDIVEDGIILHDENDFFKKVIEDLREKLEKLGAKRIKMGKRWF